MLSIPDVLHCGPVVCHAHSRRLSRHDTYPSRISLGGTSRAIHSGFELGENKRMQRKSFVNFSAHSPTKAGAIKRGRLRSGSNLTVL